MKQWYTGTVQKGDQSGRAIGFPTVNLDPIVLPNDKSEGVYACVVEIGGKQYCGTLYFGPRLIKNETNRVLEIYIHDFDEQIYSQRISFLIVWYIRPVKNFRSLQELQKQIQDDVDKSKRYHV